MSQAGGGGGGPLARAIVEITGSVEPLKAKLAEAENATKASADKMAGASGGGGGSLASPAAVQGATQYATAVGNATKATGDLATNTAKVAENTKQAGDASKFLNIGVAATAGAIAGLVRAADQLYKGIKGFADGSRALANDLKSIEASFRSDIISSLDPLTQRREAIEATKKAALEQLETEKQSRGIIGDIVGALTDEAETRTKIAKIETEASQAQARLRGDASKKEEEDKTKGAEEASKVARNLYIQSLDERGRLEAQYHDEVTELERKRDNAKSKAEKDSYQEAINFRGAIFKKDIEDIEERAKKDADIKAEALADAARKRAEEAAKFLELQRETVSALRNEVNSLFNTSNVEIGIGRLGDLMEILIAKSGER